ncbi:MAG: IPT/TIG domain-containing protein [Opitutaceae bacterium]|nr:IPT/TIG domain-containing protein [Opitutaceae bacterium]
MPPTVLPGLFLLGALLLAAAPASRAAVTVSVSVADGPSLPGLANVVDTTESEGTGSLQARYFRADDYRAVAQSFKWTSSGPLTGIGFRLNAEHAAATTFTATAQDYRVSIYKVANGSTGAAVSDNLFTGTVTLNATLISAGLEGKYLYFAFNGGGVPLLPNNYYMFLLEPIDIVNGNRLYFTWIPGATYADGCAGSISAVGTPATASGIAYDLKFFATSPAASAVSVSVISSPAALDGAFVVDTTQAEMATTPNPYNQARNSSSYRTISQSFRWAGGDTLKAAGFKIHPDQAAFTTSQKYMVWLAKAEGTAANAAVSETVFTGSFDLDGTLVSASSGGNYLHLDFSGLGIPMEDGQAYWLIVGPDAAGPTAAQVLFVAWCAGATYSDGVAGQPMTPGVPAVIAGSSNDMICYIMEPKPPITVEVLDAVPADGVDVMLDLTGADISEPEQIRYRVGGTDYRVLGQSFKWTSPGPLAGIGFLIHVNQTAFAVAQRYRVSIYEAAGGNGSAALSAKLFESSVTLTPALITGGLGGKYLHFTFTEGVALELNKYYMCWLEPVAEANNNRIHLTSNTTSPGIYADGCMGINNDYTTPPATAMGYARDLLFFLTTPAPVVKGDVVDGIVAAPEGAFFAYPHHNGFYQGLPVVGKAIGGGAQQLIQYDPATGEGTVLAVLEGMERSFSYYDIAGNGLAAMWGSDTAVTVVDLGRRQPNRVIYTAPAGCVLHMPTINPAGTKVTATVGKGPDPAWAYSLVEIDIETGVATTLAETDFQTNHAQYSPYDPAWILFSMNAGNPHRTWVWHETEAPGGARIFYPQTGADGGSLNVGHERPMFHKAGVVTCAYITSGGNPKGLYEIGFDNSRRIIYTGDALHPNISIDGKWTVFDTIGDWKNGNLVIADFATGASQVLIEGISYTSHPWHVHPHISPDGNWIVYNDANKGRAMFAKVNREALERVAPGVNAPPVIASFSPQVLAAGDSVEITGADFFNITGVSFAGIAAASFATNPAGTKITAVVPAGLTAAGRITVTGLRGGDESAAQFSVPPAVVAGFSPQIVDAGTVVTITGAGFNEVLSVTFNGAAAASFTVESAEKLLAVFPEGVTAGGKIVVTTAYGSGESPGAFTLSAPPENLARLANPVVVAGGRASLTASASGAPEPSYTWQVSVGGGQWLDITSSGSEYILSDGGRTLTINAGALLNGNRFRYIADNGKGAPVASDAVALAVLDNVTPGPVALVVTGEGDLYTADDSLHIIQRITGLTAGGGTAGLFAGAPGTAGAGDGAGAAAFFNQPSGLAAGGGTLFVADTGNNAIRAVDAAGGVTRWAGLTGSDDPAVDGSRAPYGAGLPTARFGGPAALALASDGVMYAADSRAHAIRRIWANGKVDTIAGKLGTPGAADRAAASAVAQFQKPTGLARDEAEENLYVADTGNHTIRKINLAGANPVFRVSTLAGMAGDAAWADRNGGAARFHSPRGMVVIGGTLYIADTGNNAVRAVDLAGADVTTLAGAPDAAAGLGIKDGGGTNAWFNLPMDVALDADENLYVADTGNGVIRRIDRANGNTVGTLVLTKAADDGAPVAPPGENPGGGGGGGGGGGVSVCFLAALFLLGGARFARPRR